MAKVIITSQTKVELPARDGQEATTLYRLNVLKQSKEGIVARNYWVKDKVSDEQIADPFTDEGFILSEADFDVEEKPDGTMKVKISNIRPENK